MGYSSTGRRRTGDYGVFGLGAYNGQTANKPEANGSQHLVARLTYPFLAASGQYVEVGIQGYVGRYVVASSQRTAGVGGPFEFHDNRAAVSLVVYPQPLGFHAEYTVGDGPEYDAPTGAIEKKALRGGYAQAMYMWRSGKQVVTPFVRAQYYQGGKKHETDARSYLIREFEFGSEWQLNKSLELVALYAHADRAYEDRAMRGNRQKGGRLRLQLQVNF